MKRFRFAFRWRRAKPVKGSEFAFGTGFGKRLYQAHRGNHDLGNGGLVGQPRKALPLLRSYGGAEGRPFTTNAFP
jgi:hypothetical protein